MLTREEWLQGLAGLLRPWFESAGHPLPVVRVSVGFPSKGVRSKTIGECWSGLCAEDGLNQIFIHPSKHDTIEVSAILAHELIHAAVGLKCKHHGAFKVLALAIGFEGEMTATYAGASFISMIQPMVETLGLYPHASLVAGNSSSGKKQTTRLVKCLCPACGYTVRTTAKWLDTGYPVCPCGETME